MMCSKPVELGIGEVAYRCRHAGCGFVLHDACYRLPKKIKHFAHSSHQLTLSDGHQLPAGRQSCNICAVNFDTNSGGRPSSFIYGCKRCSGFYAHQRCCRLPRTMHNNALHQHALTLLQPPQPRAKGYGGRGGRSCLNAAGHGRNARRLDNDAWTYQCNQCEVELCLACQLPGAGGDGGSTRTHQGTAGRWRNNIIANGHLLGTAIGTSLRAMGCACIGAPAPPPPTTG
jgi:hypothetical protein